MVAEASEGRKERGIAVKLKQVQVDAFLVASSEREPEEGHDECR